MKINLRNLIICLLYYLAFLDSFNTKNNDNKFIVRLENYQHTQFYGPLYIGSTKQEMNFVFSTGTNDIWLFSSDCANCNSNKLYKYDLSQTFINYTQSNFIQVKFFLKQFLKTKIENSNLNFF
jgi:hypothetical protein